MTRVFISSTCWDLLDVRREVEEHLRALGLQPVLSDRPTSDFEVAGDQHSIESCLVNVRNCDVLVCILSQRYGSKLDKFGYPGLSATHVEYREAKKAKKPIYFYVRDQLEADQRAWEKDKSVPFKGRWVKDAELFEFFDEHRAPPAPGMPETSNWYTAFRDAFELKQTLARDLRAQSRPVLLKRLIDAGKVPFLSIAMTQLTQQKSDNVLHMVAHVQVSCVGTCTAFRVEAATAWEQTAPVPRDDRQLGDLERGKTAKYAIFMPLVTNEIPNPTVLVTLRHETEYAHAVRDTFAVTLNGTTSTVTSRLIKRELLDELSYQLA